MAIINFDDIIGKKVEIVTNNVFCLNHPYKLLLFLVKQFSGKSNMLF